MVMQLHHFFFAVGILGRSPDHGSRSGEGRFPGNGATLGLVSLSWSIFLFLLFQKTSTPQKRSGFELKLVGRLMTEKTFLFLFFVTFFNSGIQNGICFWMVTFLKEMKDLSIALASSSLFLFFACLAVGRLFSSYLLTRFHETTYLLSLFSLLFVSLLLSIYAPGKWAIPFLRPVRTGPFRNLPFPSRDDGEDLFGDSRGRHGHPGYRSRTRFDRYPLVDVSYFSTHQSQDRVSQLRDLCGSLCCTDGNAIPSFEKIDSLTCHGSLDQDPRIHVRKSN